MATPLGEPAWAERALEPTLVPEPDHTGVGKRHKILRTQPAIAVLYIAASNSIRVESGDCFVASRSSTKGEKDAMC